jgi:hypothetical protein
MTVDNTSFVPYNEKRYAPKLLSKTSYGLGTVWVMDASHLPYGCCKSIAECTDNSRMAFLLAPGHQLARQW